MEGSLTQNPPLEPKLMKTVLKQAGLSYLQYVALQSIKFKMHC